MDVQKCMFPNESIIANESILADYQDSYKLVSSKSNLDPLDVYCLMVNNRPTWINKLFSFRNLIMRPFNLNDAGNLGGIDYSDFASRENIIGKKLHFFIIESFSKNEMVVIQKDKHLDIKVSILTTPNLLKTNVVISTMVHFNNKFGKFYMALIKPFHRLLVKVLMKNIA